MAGIEQIKPIKIQENVSSKDAWLSDIIDEHLAKKLNC